jgi:hypothetical protein
MFAREANTVLALEMLGEYQATLANFSKSFHCHMHTRSLARAKQQPRLPLYENTMQNRTDETNNGNNNAYVLRERDAVCLAPFLPRAHCDCARL